MKERIGLILCYAVTATAVIVIVVAIAVAVAVAVALAHAFLYFYIYGIYTWIFVCVVRVAVTWIAFIVHRCIRLCAAIYLSQKHKIQTLHVNRAA